MVGWYVGVSVCWCGITDTYTKSQKTRHIHNDIDNSKKDIEDSKDVRHIPRDIEDSKMLDTYIQTYIQTWRIERR